jgi:hypothetical protein
MKKWLVIVLVMVPCLAFAADQENAKEVEKAIENSKCLICTTDTDTMSEYFYKGNPVHKEPLLFGRFAAPNSSLICFVEFGHKYVFITELRNLYKRNFRINQVIDTSKGVVYYLDRP